MYTERYNFLVYFGCDKVSLLEYGRSFFPREATNTKTRCRKIIFNIMNVVEEIMEILIIYIHWSTQEIMCSPIDSFDVIYLYIITIIRISIIVYTH